MNKRERLTRTIAGEQVDRIPVALWRHWPGDDERAADLARSTIEFQKTYDWDFVKISPSPSYCVTDYGIQDEWRGSVDGTRIITRRGVNRSLEWTELRPLDPARGMLGKQYECARLVCDGLRDNDTPVMQTIVSPLSQARMIAGRGLYLRHMRTNPDRLHTGLNIITESTLRFLEALKRLPLAGIFYVMGQASYDEMSEEEYRTFGLPYDAKILEALPEKWWFNMAHLHGDAPMFRLCGQLPVTAINWHDRETEPDLGQGKLLFNGAVCGGLSREEHIHLGTPATIRDQARQAITQTNGRRLILSTGSAILVTSPLSNIRAVREVVETQGV